MPWLPDSEFALIDAESRAWYASLPESLKWSESAVYIRKETSQLGALCGLHWMYHQNMCDLYVSVPLVAFVSRKCPLKKALLIPC